MSIHRGGRGFGHICRVGGGAGDGSASAPSLNALSLSASTVAENSATNTIIGAIQNTTGGSTLSLFDSASSKVAISGGNLVCGATNIDYETTPSFTCTIRETLAGATNTPRDTVLTITVTNVFEAATLGSPTLNSTSWTNGTSASGSITGATTGSTLSISGQPTGLTINSGARTWAFDGTGAAGSGSFTLTETLADSANSPKNNTISYTIAAAGSASFLLMENGTDQFLLENGTDKLLLEV